MLVSSNQPYDFDRLVLLEKAKNTHANYLVDELNEDHHFYTKIVDTSDVPLLTDQFNPSEVLINPINSKLYVDDFQKKQPEDKENVDYSNNLVLGITLSIIAGVWLLYFKKKIWISNIPPS